MQIRLSTPTRIAIGLTSLVTTWLLLMAYLGFLPDCRQQTLDNRSSLCESVAVQCCLAAQTGDIGTMRVLLDSLVSRNPAVLSAAVRRKNDRVLVESGRHVAQWQARLDRVPPGAQIKVPIFENRSLWGWLEVRFQPIGGTSWWDRALSPLWQLLLTVACGAFVLQRFYLKKVLHYRDPTSVVPERVRAALDALSEGVLILDNRQQIVLANRAFAERLGESPERLQGVTASTLDWALPDDDQSGSLPWVDAMENGVAHKGVMMRMPVADNQVRTLSVNAIPIVGGNGARRGALATFDDITTVEQQNLELAQMLAALKESRDEIQRQNRELHLLATCDPLTHCLNRRSFFEKLETQWNTAARYGQPLSFIMVDVDHFKSINDRFGHSRGDEVLKMVGETLRATARDCDLVCRYGGEEFCILLPQQEPGQALTAAERYRQAIAALEFDTFGVTASFGAATTQGAAGTPQELLDRADKALYAAKHGGRNRVVAWDSLAAGQPTAAPVTVAITAPETAVPTAAPAPAVEPAPRETRERSSSGTLPTVVVQALTAALARRDTLTAERSRRVAEHCFATARGLLPQRECHELEVAALLHDIGKLAIPDAILFKSGELTEGEWAVMRTHDRMGTEILAAAAAPPALIEIVRTHHAWYAGSPHNPALPRGNDIPLGARILAIADAFMSMVSDCCYRKSCTWEEAFAELRRAAGTQFDPELVERFIRVTSENDQSRHALDGSVSHQAALDLGLQIERLALAVDRRDVSHLAEMAGHLATTAARDGAAEIAELARELETLSGSHPDLAQLIQLTTQLLDLCRTIQSSHLAEASPRA